MDRVAKSAVEVAPARPWFSRRTFAFSGRRLVRGHGPPFVVLFGVTLWLARGLLLTSQLPAGTDMLGFVSRSAQNATVSNALSLWTPTSLGYPRTWSLDNVMGALTIVTGNPVLTVKFLDVLVIFATGASAYLLGWSWFRKRTVGLVAALLYMLSQAALSRWGSGQLNVAMAIALAPVLLWSWSQSLQQFTVRRALTLALLVTAMLLIRLDMLLYVAPFMVLYACFAAPYAAPGRPVRNAVKTIGVAVPVALALNVYQILPVALGYGPRWLSTGQLFDLQQISTHTLSAYQSLLGFGREIGYLAFTGQQTWSSFPFLPLWAYYAFASVVVVCAFLALAWNRGRRTIFLAVMAIVAVFLAKGSDPPFGDLYTWAINHIPIVSDIRDPNRWLIFEALAIGLLAGITIDRLLTCGPTVLARIRIPMRLGRGVVRGIALVVVAAMLVQVAPTIASGLKTWEPAASEVQLLNSLRGNTSGMTATIPYDQSTAFVDTPAYSGYEHDIGYESPLFTGVPTLGTGDWDQRTSDYVAYTSTLLGSGNSAFAPASRVCRREPYREPQRTDPSCTGRRHHSRQLLPADRGAEHEQPGRHDEHRRRDRVHGAVVKSAHHVSAEHRRGARRSGRARGLRGSSRHRSFQLGRVRCRRPHHRGGTSATAERDQAVVARGCRAGSVRRARCAGVSAIDQALRNHLGPATGSRDFAAAVGPELVRRRAR